MGASGESIKPRPLINAIMSTLSRPSSLIVKFAHFTSSKATSKCLDANDGPKFDELADVTLTPDSLVCGRSILVASLFRHFIK